MGKAERFRLFLTDYEVYLEAVLRPEHRRVKLLMERWKRPAFWEKYISGNGGVVPSPIKAIYTRIKRPEKVVDKILQKPREYPAGIAAESFKKMHDCIGVRVIIYFLSQLPVLDREIRQSSFLEVSKDMPPKAYMRPDLAKRFGLSHIALKEKDSGYTSVHYVVRLKKKTGGEAYGPWFELQVRTLSQELWSEMEHILAYKSEKRTNFSAKQRFNILSKEISALDEHFNLLYEELIRNQEVQAYESDEMLSVENLPYTLSMIGVRCAQQDFDTILTLLHSRGVDTISALTGLATPKRMETIKNTYISVLGRAPDNFELIASLGALIGVDDDESEAHTVESHIEFGRFWNKFRKRFMKANLNSPRSYE